MASESCSTSSSSSGDDFVPIFLLCKVMKSLRRNYDKKRSTIRWMKQTQLQLKLSPVKTKAIQTWTCVRLILQWGTHSGVSAESALRGIEDRTASVVLIMSSEWRNFTQRRTTTRRSTTVAVDLPLFARIFLQLLVLDGVERLFGHDQAPSKRLPPATSEWKNFVFCHLRFFALSMDRSFTIVCIFSTNFRSFRQRLKSQSSHPTNIVEIPRSSCKPMKAHAILSVLVVLAAAESATEDRFQRRRPTRLTVSRTPSARSSRRSKAMEPSTRGKADTESGRTLPKSPARKRVASPPHVYLGPDFCATGD